MTTERVASPPAQLFEMVMDHRSNPETLERLRQDPSLVPAAVEETLRYDPPVHTRDRIALEDIEIDGTTIPAGANMALMLADSIVSEGAAREPVEAA
jgi:DNA gyrase inhibitor GyrI